MESETRFQALSATLRQTEELASESESSHSCHPLRLRVAHRKPRGLLDWRSGLAYPLGIRVSLPWCRPNDGESTGEWECLNVWLGKAKPHTDMWVVQVLGKIWQQLFFSVRSNFQMKDIKICDELNEILWMISDYNIANCKARRKNIAGGTIWQYMTSIRCATRSYGYRYLRSYSDHLSDTLGTICTYLHNFITIITRFSKNTPKHGSFVIRNMLTCNYWSRAMLFTLILRNWSSLETPLT